MVVACVNTLPLKLRIYNFNFAEKVNIGSQFGWRKRTNSIKENYLSLNFTLGLSVNNIDASSIRNVGVAANDNIAALSLGSGFVFQSGKIQLGLYYGFDFLSHNNWVKYRWDYNKRPWFGIGIGANIFNNESNDKTPEKTTTQ